ncbi:uncharacterized protein DUF4233 [Actinomadura hallensis]|uniref:Uncharacterized protein DUF4233 n=1 Tax=Actinomadura hallensis TaxID=337895 RepID=A0A543IBS9_9ACTN|nr:DUF4233 domain-containing protein [Actinomadura hallensis]TQM68039.1 uncharacterized protein DUF4233 [Actinomadura hallensis]HLV73873.1 DUF4233 domain-containing protein [Vulgatibacteraceae bacterium]
MSAQRGANPARRLFATILACEAIMTALAFPVAVSVMKVDGATAGAVCGGLAVACLLVAGLLRHSWAVAVGTVLQVLIIATGFMVPAMFFLGVVFGALWATAIWMGRKAASVQAR